MTIKLQESSLCATELQKQAASNDTTSYSSAPPEYLKKVYYWSYLNPRNVHWLDREWIVKIILWWQHSKLRQTAFDEIRPGDQVFQTAAVYGDFSPALAAFLGDAGKLNVIDVAPIQVGITRKKLIHSPNTQVLLADAATCSVPSGTHVILSYFLLHEVPDNYKEKILSNLLDQLSDDAKLVIVDYHKPYWSHPLKPLMSAIFDLLEPYAKAFWRQEISDFSAQRHAFNWEKSTYFGGLYQKVVVTRK